MYKVVYGLLVDTVCICTAWLIAVGRLHYQLPVSCTNRINCYSIFKCECVETCTSTRASMSWLWLLYRDYTDDWVKRQDETWVVAGGQSLNFTNNMMINSVFSIYVYFCVDCGISFRLCLIFFSSYYCLGCSLHIFEFCFFIYFLVYFCMCFVC